MSRKMTAKELKKSHQKSWEEHCLRDRGKILTGWFSHYCCDWDGMTVDITTPEISVCTCYSDAPWYKKMTLRFAEKIHTFNMDRLHEKARKRENDNT